MPTHLASLDSLVHPHQMEVQEFSSYALVIDARSTEAYQEDHIPGAVSVPVAAQRLQVPEAGGTALVSRDAEPSVPYALAAHLGGLSAGASVLVYCDRGGLDSLVWADPLKALGYRVDVLGGGWGNYRRWVDAGLEVLPRALTFRRLLAPPVGGLCLVLRRLAAVGEQILDLTELAGQRIIPGLALDGGKSPAQAAFDTALLNSLRRFDPRRPVWVRDYSADVRQPALAPRLREALSSCVGLRLEVPPPIRARAWLERLQQMGPEIPALLSAISTSAKSPAATVIDQWRSLVEAGRLVDVLTEVILRYVDSHGPAVPANGTVRLVRLESLRLELVDAQIELWRNIDPWRLR